MKRASLVGLAALLCILASARAEEAAPPPPAPAGGVTPAYAPPSVGPAKPETSEPVALENLAKGDRVLLLMKNGQQFEGHLAELTPVSFTLDFTFSRQKMTGLVTFPRPELAGARRLSALTKEEREAILEKRRQGLLEARAMWAEAVGPAASTAAKPVEPATEQKAAEEKQIADYRSLLAEFPPDQGWGPEQLAQIRYRTFIVGLAPTYREQRFWHLFDQWSEAKTKVELYDQQQKQERETLLTLFPTEEGWNAAKKQQLEEKQKAGEQLTKLEAQFLKDYDNWQKAVAAKQAEKPAATGSPAPAGPSAASPTPPAGTPPAPPAPSPAPAAPASESVAPEPSAPPSTAPPAPAPASPGTSEPPKP